MNSPDGQEECLHSLFVIACRNFKDHQKHRKINSQSWCSQTSLGHALVDSAEFGSAPSGGHHPWGFFASSLRT